MEKKSISKVIAFIKDNILDVLSNIDNPYFSPRICKLVVSHLDGPRYFCSISPFKGYVYIYELAQLEESLCNRFDKAIILNLDFEVHEISFFINLTDFDIEHKFEKEFL